jgi:dimethylargininase
MRMQTEDTAVVTGAHAVLTTPGAPSRRAETREVLPALARHCHVHEMQGDARLDGGDVLRVDDLLFIGLSRRTNQAGAEFLSRVAAKDGLRTTTVPLASGLHLKSVCSVVDASTIVCAPSLDAHIADGLRSSACALVQVPEEPGANVLGLADAVVVSAAAPLTAALLRSCGKRVIELEVSEIHKADGALTCLSVRIPRAGCWSG